ncbi:DgyrCDS6487 [Dimorphilus gyrociliatus]|uniref:Protein THEM6 n=1 Tax=Dimorphilus gyrociliatus TaxID=2664684 RepID=A0A7I8VSZ7_9ANNE|nr:DgyrCDS6487 [Dimorphilus gyrociliatus]
MIEETLVVKRRVGLRDLDSYFHMNNARYLWYLDASRAIFFITSGLNLELYKFNKNGYIVAASSTIRYRRSLQLFEKYRIVSRIAYFDEKNVYMEHKFISEKDEFISSIAYLKLAFVKVKPIDVFKSYLKVSEDELQLECPKALKSWMEFQEHSSQSLKKSIE